MSAPRWAAALLARAAPADQADSVVGDLEEAHAVRVARRGRTLGTVLTAAEALDMSVALLRERIRRRRRGRSRAGAPRGAHGARAGRSQRGGGWGVSWLDFKLGLRMLVRYPGLTVVGGLAIAFAIWIGAGTFEFMTQVVRPTLPLPDGERIVGVRVHDLETGGSEPRLTHDLAMWRQEAGTLVGLGAFRSTERNLITGDGVGEPTRIAEMSASGFAVAGVPPLLGRTLTEADEAPGAPDVVVLGHDVWRARFAADPGIVGRTVGIGRARATVVGVMPEGFAFPVSHGLWTPLRLTPSEHGRREGPALQVFARLAPGVGLAEARAEMATLGLRAADAFPDTHARLRVNVLPYARAVLNISPGAEREVMLALFSSNVFLFALIAVICCNVALLIFARAAARESELVVRAALGASRRRIVGQMFVEALVLGAVGAAVGLAGASAGLRWGMGVVEAQLGESGIALPFWFNDGLSPATVGYALLLTAFGAVVAGILPALKVTRGVGTRLREVSAGGGGLRFGGVWTAVIITQVTVTVAFPAVAFVVRQDQARIESRATALANREYLAARLEMDREPPPDAAADTSLAAFRARYRASYDALEQRVLDEPRVSRVTFADRLPSMYHPWNQIEVDEGAVEPPDARGHRMGVVRIDPDFFDVLGAPLLAGRPFDAGDLESDARVVIVNESFAENVLGGLNPVGRRVRFIASESSREPSHDGPWHEIVGLVPDMGTVSGYGQAGVYLPAEPGSTYPVHIAIRVQGDPLSFTPRLLQAATAIDPTLRLHEIIRMDETVRDDVRFYEFWFRLILVVSALALLLSLAGIYAVMSFTVARRTREIGIRIALGSAPERVVTSIFRGPLTQIGVGIVLGVALTGTLTRTASGTGLGMKGALAVAAYALIMTLVCLVACLVPTRRALAVEPTEALRAES